MNKKYIKLNLLFLELGTIATLVSSCGPVFTREYINTSDTSLIISNDKPTSGSVIEPSKVVLTNTIPDLVKNESLPQPFMFQEKENIDVLVLPIHFKDDNNIVFEDTIKENINAAFNGSDTKKVYPTSVKDFYNRSSFGKINLNFTVADWYTAGESKQYYDDNTIRKNVIERALVKGSIGGKEIDKTKFDKNNDGIIDAVFAVYAKPNYQNDPVNKNKIYWAYTSFQGRLRSDKTNPRLNGYSFASYDFMSGYQGAVNARTYIHETGHLFGLNDYYDYKKAYFPTAGWDMMDLNICDHNSYSKMLLGWKKPYIVYGDAVINAQDVIKNNSCVVVLEDDKELNKDKDGNYLFSPMNEYMLLDYFDISQSSLNHFDSINKSEQKKIPDVELKESGFRMYHVDSRPVIVESKNEHGPIGRFYTSTLPINAKNRVLRLINNSSKGAEEGETSVLNKYKLQVKELNTQNVDYYNEITLIGNEKYIKNNKYDSLYNVSINGIKEQVKIDTDLLFKPGDVFTLNDNYQAYFVNGSTNNKFNFNDVHESFSTKISFE